mmetsp:Transcript_78173/g.108618  ORF Transcript_78173/g.108618 Transcript_78173/m.108618 type:complete len:373 (-) Transcript_78173:500-1618(-)
MLPRGDCLGGTCCAWAVGPGAAASSEVAEEPAFRLRMMWALSKSPVASAAMSDSSPASTDPATIRASCSAFAPGVVACAPRSPSISSAAACAGRVVPPPTVPTSTEGIVTDTRKPSPSLSITVMHVLLSTFCAGSWPVARYRAVTILEAWALYPPTLPATADPIMFFAMFNRTMRSTASVSLTFNVAASTAGGITTSHATLFPRPSTQLMALGFLSVHTFPDSASTSIDGKRSARAASACVTPLVIMFIPIASPVNALKRRYTFLSATFTRTFWRRAKREVESNAALSSAALLSSSTHAFSAAASAMFPIRTTGARVMPLPVTVVMAPPDWVMARQPRLVEAIKAPSVVDMGTVYVVPSSMSGPTVPVGIGT